MAGCVHEPGPHEPRAAAPVPAAMDLAFAPLPMALPAANPVPPPPRTAPDVVRLALRVPDGGGDRRVDLDWFRPVAPGPRPVILLLPVSGGHFEIENLFARYFADQGYAAVLVRRDESYSNGQLLAAVDPILRRSVVDGRRVVDWIGTRPELDPDRIGLFGISLGGIEATVLAALEPRIGAAVIGLAGGDLPQILVTSEHAGLARDRREWMDATGRDAAAAEAYLRRTLAHEPLQYAAYGDPRRVLMILARFDRAIPYRNGVRLRAALGDPETITLPTGHYTAALAIPWLRPAVLEFFERRLRAPEPAGPLRRTVVADRTADL